MTSAELINQDSGNCEWFTPQPIIEAARACMGGIDLDPFSSELANKRVKAESIFTKEDNGLSKMWWGRVWMNHPFSKEMNAVCIRKIVDGWGHRYFDVACCITFASTSERWFQPLLRYPQCFLHGRTNYHLPNGEMKRGVTKGSVVTYLGDYPEKFHEAFKLLGTVKVQFVSSQ